jgi:hypothetical protein
MSVDLVIARPEGEIIPTFIAIDVEIIHRQVVERGRPHELPVLVNNCRPMCYHAVTPWTEECVLAIPAFDAVGDDFDGWTDNCRGAVFNL